MEKKIIQTAKCYFKYFQNKNLKEIENLFANTIYYTWEYHRLWEFGLRGIKHSYNMGENNINVT